ncbi:hypothetical protein INR77_02340 [Erythrobacter sp. SCSIO 43205]|uniref:hypothetical protein n=1 Tax=Erythrobacter sp. SCSIO 43205 TaxID=2779361 RepID=UPI001CA93557|nr:hypothetical protein [Erythrobacter sp. SCSIO 43205]UAB78596.1 hypothetical protein INR77_02340 [Erythrobacter sp. SCSIO 43205]
MKFKTLITVAALTLCTTAWAQEASRDESSFVGRYDGGSFETAMGMVIEADGSFRWGLSVGSLDARATGHWAEKDGVITFTSDPKPVPPQFTLARVEPTKDGPAFRIVWAGTDRPFQYARVYGLCANGETVYDYVSEGDWTPGEECDRLEKVAFHMRSYDIQSEAFDVSAHSTANARGTMHFEFHRNDLGVVDFDEATGRFVDGILEVNGPLGSMTFRKVEVPAE